MIKGKLNVLRVWKMEKLRKLKIVKNIFKIIEL